MTKKIFIIILNVVLGSNLFADNTPYSSESGEIQSEQAQNIIWEKKLYRQIEFLTDSICGGRATGTRGNTEAAFWLIRQFRQHNLLPFNGSYSSHFTEPAGCNILGMLPGSNKHQNDSYIIICAHYDGLGVLNGILYPGADSNASGVVAMTSLAEMFHSIRMLGQAYRKNIIFAALDAKSSSMRGSRAVWELLDSCKLRDPVSGNPISSNKISLVVNLDQLGGTSGNIRSARTDYMVMLGRNALGQAGDGLAASCNLRYKTWLDLRFDYFGSKDFTNIFYKKVCDQRVFLEHGIPSVLFTSGITMNNNKPYDTVDSLDMEILKRRIFLIFHWIDEVLKKFD